jgi:hypothetical protein
LFLTIKSFSYTFKLLALLYFSAKYKEVIKMNLYLDKELFQWEKNRYVFLELEDGDPQISHIQFYNKNSNLGPEIEIINNSAKIPDYLLEEKLPVIAIACTGESGKTLAIMRKEFKILERVRPEKYTDESNEPPVPGKPGYDDEIVYDEEIIYDGGEEL